MTFSLPEYRPFFDIFAQARMEQEQNNTLQEQSWIKKGHPFEESEFVDFKLLSMIAGDAFIAKNPQLEGGYSLEILSFFLNFFRQLKGPDAEPEVTELLEGAVEIQKLMTGSYADFERDIPNIINGRERIWFPSGWSDQNHSAHAVLLEIDYRSNSITIYNTGSGLSDYHQQTGLLNKTTAGQYDHLQSKADKAQGFIKITGCDPAKLRSPELYQFLYELCNRHREDPNIKLDYTNVIEGLKKYLGGRLAGDAHLEENPSLLRRPQRAGTCTARSPLAAIYYTLFSRHQTAGKYKRLKFYWQTLLLVQVMKQGITRQKKHLVQDIASNIARSLDKHNLKGMLKEDDLHGWEATLLDIEKRLAEIKDPLMDEDTDIVSLKKDPGISDHCRLDLDKPFALLSIASGNIDAGLKAFRPENGEAIEVDHLSIVQALNRLKELAATIKRSPENIGKMYLLYAYIVRRAKEDPAAQLEGYSFDISSLKAHFENPAVHYTMSQTHRALQRAYEQLKGHENEKQLFCLDKEEARILITAETMTKDPTLIYLSQFLADDPRVNRLEAMLYLLTHPELMPESVRCFYEAWYTANAIFLSVDESLDFRPFAPLPVIIQAHNPKMLAVDFAFRTSNKPVVLPFRNPIFEKIVNATKPQNEIVAKDRSDLFICQETWTDKIMQMIGLDRIDLPNRLVAFFSRNIDLFLHDGMCSYFLSQLLRPCVLLNQIEAQPLFLEKLEKFCRDAIDQFIQNGAYSTALSCMLMTRKIELFLGNFRPVNYRDKIVDEILPNVAGTHKNPSVADLLRLLLSEFHDDPHAPEYEADLAAYILVERPIKISTEHEQEYTARIEAIKNHPGIENHILRCFNLTGDDHLLNFDERKVYRRDGAPLIGHSGSLHNHPVYKSYFGSQPVVRVSSSRNSTLLRNTDGSKELVIVEEDSKFKFVRNYKGQAYEYVDDCSQQAFAIMLGYSKGTLWRTQKGGYENILMDENGIPSLLVSGFYYLGEVKRLSDEAKLHLHSEDLIIYYWIDKNKDVVEYNYGDLNFKRQYVDGSQRLYCRQYPGYYWVQNDSTLGLMDVGDYFTLRNMAGNTIILAIDPKINKDKKKQIVFPFKYADGELSGETVSAQLYLIEHHIEHHRYEKAFEIVKSLNMLERFQDNYAQHTCEVFLFSRLFDDLAKKWHPNELAIFLHLTLIWLENMAKFPAKVGAKLQRKLHEDQTLKEALQRYLNLENNCTYCRLTRPQKLNLVALIQETLGIDDFNSIVSEWSGRVVFPREFVNPVIDGHLKNNMFSNSFSKLEFQRRYSGTFVFSRSFFNDNFDNLYAIALSGTAEQKEWLRKVLNFNYAYYNNSQAFTVIYHKIRFPYLPFIVFAFEAKLQMVVCWLFKTAVNYLLRKWGQTQYEHGKLQMPVVQSQPLQMDRDGLRAADAEFDAYFKQLRDTHFKKLEEEEEKKVQEDFPNLPVGHASGNVALKLEQEQRDLDYFRENILQPSHEIVLVDIEGLQKNLKATISDLSGRLKSMKAALLWQINSGHTFQRIANQRQLKWEDLQKLSLRCDYDLFVKMTGLDRESAERAISAIGNYLVLESRLNQMVTVKETLVQVQKPVAGSSKMQSIKNTAYAYIGLFFNQVTEPIAEGSSKKRLMTDKAYEIMSMFPSESRDYSQVDRLWFECANKYLYRKEQVAKLQELQEGQQQHSELLAEMPTGYGKTKLMVPTLNQMVSKQGKAVVNCWPATLEMTNTADMKVQMKKSFGKEVDRLAFDRASNFKAENLKAIYRALLADIKNGRSINCCAESIRALELHFLLTLDSDPVDDEKMTYFIKILKLFRTVAWVSIDEEHILLSPMDRLIYTLGKSFTLPEREVDIVQKFFEMLMDAPLNASINLMANANHKLTDQQYQAIAKELAILFRSHLACDRYGDEFIAFVTGPQVQIPVWLHVHPKKEEISLVKGVLSFILQRALENCVDENFGLSRKHLQSCEFAISYIGSNSPKETDESPSQYRNPHETLVKTLITYFYKGLSKEQVQKLIFDLQEKVKQEMLLRVPIANIDAFKVYRSFNISLKKPLIQLDRNDIDTISQEMSKNRLAIFHYIKTMVVPQIKIYEESIVSDAQNFRSQLASSLSLSATPQHKATHGPNTHFVPMRGTSGQVTHLLLTKCGSNESIHRMHNNGPLEAIDEVVDIIKGRDDFKAIIDIGAQCKGLSNHEVAIRLTQDSDVRGVVYMDEKDGTFKIFDKVTKSVVDFATAKVLPEQRHTYYDQNRCFGSDIEQACDAAALLLTSERNTKAEIGQGMGRMRKPKGQTFAVGVPAKLAQQNVKELLVFWISNQVEEEGQLNYQSQLQQYDNTLRRKLLDLMFEYDESPGRAVTIFRNNRDIFISKEHFSPYLQYASTPKEAQTQTVLEQKKQSVIAQIKAASGLSSNQRDQLIRQLNEWDAGELFLPEIVSGSSSLGMECEVLQEVEIEVQLNIENKNQLQDEVFYRSPMVWDKKLRLFKKGWERSGTIFPMFKRFLKVFLKRYPGSLTDETIILSSGFYNLSKYNVIPLTAVAVLCTVLNKVAQAILKVNQNILPIIGNLFSLYNILLITFSLINEIIAGALMTAAILARTAFITTAVTWATSYVVKNVTIFYAKKFHADNYVCRVNELIKMHLSGSKSNYTRSLSRSAAIFSDHFYATNNFYRAGSLDDLDKLKVIKPQEPLNKDQKPIFEIMLIEDAGWFGRKHLKAIAIDKNDSVFFREKLQEDSRVEASEAAKRTRKVAIYDPVNDLIVAQGKNAISLEELKQRREFHELTASAKFLNGEIKYTDQELDYLEEKVKQIGKKKVREFFMGRILTQFQPRHLNFLKTQKHSRLYKILAGKLEL